MRHLLAVLLLTTAPLAAAAQSAPLPVEPQTPSDPAEVPAVPAPVRPRALVLPTPFPPDFVAPADLDLHMTELRERFLAQTMESEEALERAREALLVTQRLESESGRYETGLRLLELRRYEDAITQFDRTTDDAPALADAARYWKAFAEYKLARTQEALATLTALRQASPNSRYAADAKVLEAEVRRIAGSPVNPADLDDDEIKLLAINAMLHSDPVRATPLLEGVLQSTNSLRVKRQALFVLAQSDQPRAREILLSYARGSGNPDLQRRAIGYLVAADGDDASLDLTSLYQSTEDVTVRRTIIDALAGRRQADALVTLARQETDREMKTSIVRRLSAMAAQSPAAQEYLMEVIR